MFQGLFFRIVAIAYLAKYQAIAQQIKGIVLALAFAQKRMQNLLLNLL